MLTDLLRRKFLRRPQQSEDGGLTAHTDTPPNPATAVVRPTIRPIRPSEGLIQPTMPAPTRDTNAPLISPKLLKRPVPVEFESGTPMSEIQPANKLRPLRPGRDSEITRQKIRETEGTPAVNEDRGFKSKAWDVLKQSGKGFLQGYAQTGDLSYAAGNAIAGGGAQVIDPALDEKQKRQKKLAELYGTFDKQTKLETTQDKINADRTKAELEAEDKRVGIQKTQTDISAQEAKTINEKISPLIDIVKAQKSVSPEIAERLTKETGLPFSAAQWQTYIDKEFNGKTFTRSEFDPRFSENQTVPVDPTKVPRNVQIGGGEALPLTSTQAAPILAANAQSNANRQQNQSQFETNKQLETDKFNSSQNLEAQKSNAQLNANYNKQFLELLLEQSKQSGTVIANSQKMMGLSNQLQSLTETLNGIDTTTDEGAKRYNQIADRLTKTQGEFDTEFGNTVGGTEALNKLKALRPEMPRQINAPKINNPKSSLPKPKRPGDATNTGGKTVTRAQVEQFAKDRGINYFKALEIAKADGYKLQ